VAWGLVLVEVGLAALVGCRRFITVRDDDDDDDDDALV